MQQQMQQQMQLLPMDVQTQQSSAGNSQLAQLLQ